LSLVLGCTTFSRYASHQHDITVAHAAPVIPYRSIKKRFIAMFTTAPGPVFIEEKNVSFLLCTIYGIVQFTFAGFVVNRKFS
jgi:hypothetical protein